MKKKALGRGLESLIPERPVAALGSGHRVLQVEIDRIVPNRYQPRHLFVDERISDLAESIKTHGVIQPVLLRSLKNGGYELIAGERRLRAVRLLELKTIPALVQEATDEKSLELALIENIQREDLNPIETAEAYRRLMDDFQLTQEEVARKVGKDRATVANILRILSLPDEVKLEIAAGRISLGHAKALLALPNPADQIAAAAKIVADGLSVRETEGLVKEGAGKGKKKGTEAPSSNASPQIRSLETRLQRVLGTKVRIVGKGGRGKIVVEYYSSEDLQRILEVFEG